MSTYTRYAEDLTGTNPDNLVAGELIPLSDRPIRAAVPKYGPFFVDTLSIYDNYTQRKLDKGIDYDIPMISQEATLRTAQEVADAILIKNSSVSAQISVTYQAIGGLWQNNIANIVAIYQSYLNDNRSVDWTSGIFGKPNEFPPSPHPHFMNDIFGWEPVAYELEQIKQAILIGQTPAFQAFIDAFESRMATIQDMEAGLPSDRLVSLKDLLYVVDKYNFNSMVAEPEHDWIVNGGSLWVSLKALNVAPDAVYYWTVENVTTDASSFTTASGVVQLTRGQGKFMIQAAPDGTAEVEKEFYIAIRRGGPTGQIVAKSWQLRLLAHPAYVPMHIIDGMKACCTTDPDIVRTPVTTYITRSRANATYS